MMTSYCRSRNWLYGGHGRRPPPTNKHRRRL